MSTKIYNGYRIAGLGGTRPDVFAFIDHLRTVLEPVYRAAYVTALVARTVELIDTDHIGTLCGPPSLKKQVRKDRRPIYVASNEFEAAHRRANHDGLREPGMDFECAATFIADPDDPTGPLYALLYTERDEYERAWDDIPGVSEYGYWNNTDQLPPGVTWAGWKQRGANWDRVLGSLRPS